ncbi:hypothetical protein [Nocardia testacea]|uniref:hypothetical protein n=1 Tax=Nocardia testacea TaxID=248551 RepID=UPI0002E1F208|nr:hypothetical protein [Nocardia testacea]
MTVPAPPSPPPHIERTAAHVTALWHEVRQLLVLLDLTLPDIVDIATMPDPADALTAWLAEASQPYSDTEIRRRFRRISELSRAAAR